MDYTHLGLLAATITSLQSGLEYKEADKSISSKSFDGKAVLAWLQNNWPGIGTQAEAIAAAQVLVTKSILTTVNSEDRQFSEKNLYTFGVNPQNEVLVEHDRVEHTTEELVELAQKSQKKQITGTQVILWLIKDLKVSRVHAVQIAARLLHLGLLSPSVSSPTPEGFQNNETTGYIINGQVSHLPLPDDISKVYELEHVPTIIGNDCKMDGVRLVYKGYLVAKYQRSPYLLVSHVTEEQVHICAPPKAAMPAQLSSISSSPSIQQPTIIHWVSHKSIVFALLSDGSLEGVDVESNQTQDYPATTQTLASSVLGLLADDLTVIGLVSNGLILWDRSSIKPPRLVNLPVQISSPLAPECCSLLPDNQILLVYTGQSSEAVFTLWTIKDIGAGKVQLLMKGVLSEQYGRITCVGNHKDRLIFAGEKSKLMCWTRPSADEINSGNSNPNVAPLFVKTAPKDSKATTIFIDSWFLLVGDSTGLVTLHSRKTGERIYALNVACGNAVNKIVRVGRWIFCAYDTKLSVFDIYRSDHPSPIQLYTSSHNLPIRDFQVNPGAITLLLGGPAVKVASFSTLVPLRTSSQAIPVSATASVNRIGRTKVAVWAPRLDALDVYLKKPSLAQSHPILPALIYTYRRIVDILSKCVHEDVAEYRATLEWMRLTIDYIIKSSHERKDDDVMGIGGVSFLVLRALQLAGDKYCSALVRIAPPGSDPKQVFSRVLSSSRRRADLDRLNASMYAALSEAVNAVGSGWQHINAAEPPFIDDAEGCAMWKAGFGASCLMADWSRFFDILRVHQMPTAPFDSSQEAILKYILDPSGTHHVSQHRFGAFLRGFGPLSQCISNTLIITNPSWFVGYLSRVEGEYLLQTQVPGTFMIRLSRSAHAFTISVMHSDGKVHHIVVDPRPAPPSSPSSETPSPPSPTPSSRSRVFTVLEAVGPERYFSSLAELIQNYPHALRTPYNDSLHCMNWFQGDISSEEATHMLSQSQPGTFLVHLNTTTTTPPLSPGATPFRYTAGGVSSWTVSVMGTDHTVHHLAIIQHADGYSLGTHASIFPSLPALVHHYMPYGLLKNVDTSCKTIPRTDIKEKSRPSEIRQSIKPIPPIPSSSTNGQEPPLSPNNKPFNTIQNPTPNDTVPNSSPFPFTGQQQTTTTTTTQQRTSDPKPAILGNSGNGVGTEVEWALTRAKAAVASLHQFVIPSAEHYRLIVLAQVLLYSQRQLKSNTLLPRFTLPSSSVEPVLTPKQMDADRNILQLSFPHLEYLLEVQARDTNQDPALFIGKVDNIMDAIGIFDKKKVIRIGQGRVL